jgi:16S rRNA (guanine527-N7)-methyltransferase
VKQSARFDAEDFRQSTNVSPETLKVLCLYEKNLFNWNERINLVSKRSIDSLWQRHFYDSAQIFELLGSYSGPLIDIGSGAGFPGLVLSILGARDVILVESDQKKAAFLADTALICGADARVLPVRAEAMPKQRAGIVTARAVAPMTRLLEIAYRFFGPGTRGIFLKGQNVVSELTEAHKIWKLQYDLVPSNSDPSGTIVVVREVSRVRGSA